MRQAPWGDMDAWTATVRDMLTNPQDEATLRSSVAEHAVEQIQQRWKTVYESF